MGKDTAIYNASVMRDYFQNGVIPKAPADIILDILKCKGEEMKRDEIIRAFQQTSNARGLEVEDIVTGALTKLEKQGTIVRISHGIYKVI